MQRPACGCSTAQRRRPPAAGSGSSGNCMPHRPQQQQQQQQRGRAAAADALPPEVAALAATDPGALQDLIVGGAVTAAVGAALYSGLKKDPAPCELCMGTGGIRCFGCEGGGTMDSLASVDDSSSGAASPRPPRRDPVGRSSNPRACRVCGGTGLVLCSKCRGAGYIN